MDGIELTSAKMWVPIPRVEPEVSPFSIKQMWRSTPLGVVEEIFDHFDVRTSTRLCRVSSGWNDSLRSSPSRNRGAAVIRWNRWRYPRLKNFERVTKAFAWTNKLLVKENSIKHLIFVGNSPQLTDDKNHGAEYYNAFKSFSHPITKFTFCRNKLGIDEFFKRTVVLLKLVETVQFIDFEMLPLVGGSAWMFGPYDFRGPEKLRTMEFYLRTIAPTVKTSRLVMKMSDFDKVSDRGTVFLLDFHPFDSFIRVQAVTQNQSWLISTMKNITGGTLDAIKLADAGFAPIKALVRDRNNVYRIDESTQLKTEATHDGRELSSFDCEFFARLLWILMDKPFRAGLAL